MQTRQRSTLRLYFRYVKTGFIYKTHSFHLPRVYSETGHTGKQEGQLSLYPEWPKQGINDKGQNSVAVKNG